LSERSIDLEAPLLPQVPSLGEGYEAWVHRSLKRDRSLRIFRNGVLESFTHISWWMVLVVWVPLLAGLLYAATEVLGLSWPAVGWRFAAGILLWTLIEYGLHRYVFHHRFRSNRGHQLHFLLHGVHHLDPWDRTRLVFPPLAGLIVAALIFGALRLAMALPDATAVMAGTIAGYIVYDMAHYYTHHAKPASRVGKFLKRYHLEHHHREPGRMFGVSTPLWDLLFRSGRDPSGRAEGR
jgi:sterol desaturase/sphingolipid hydroxylase (fatty acid hydroxylase superfamily)